MTARPIEREQWRELFAAADEALELEPAQRSAFLERWEATHPHLAAELRALLEGADADSPLESPAATFASPILNWAASDEPDDAGGKTFGPYRVLRLLGHGGMATVYLAERADDQFRKQVALKVFPRRSSRDQRLVQRFIDERQILASLDHPDIARLLDGGVTDDGLPWFAMEYVDGLPIDRYCDERRLSVDGRLNLFCRVCAAVQYAHRNLVVHRDLKPSNILVTAEGRVALLDFGIATLQDRADPQSASAGGHHLLTPLYASPEEIRGESVSTASDVYALGVLLHVLLTGQHPYRLATRDRYEIARVVVEQTPDPPSVTVRRANHSQSNGSAASTTDDPAALRESTPGKLSRRLRGDLDAIVARAIDKDPSRRYATAEQFETDVRRHLEGKPVVARPDSRLYHSLKFVGRHRMGIAIALAIAFVLVSLAVAMAVQRERIRAQSELIAVERDRARVISRLFSEVFQAATPGQAGRHVTSRSFLDSATARIDNETVGPPEQRARLMVEMARAYHRLGLNGRALALMEKSLTLQRGRQFRDLREEGDQIHLLAGIQLAEGGMTDAEKNFANALTLRRRTLGARHRDVARTLNGLASVRRAQKRLPEAESLAREAMAIDEASHRDGQTDLAESARTLARVLLDKGDYQESEKLLRRALAIQRAAHGDEHADVARAVFDLATTLSRAGQRDIADSLARVGLQLSERLATAAAIGGILDRDTTKTERNLEQIAEPIRDALADSSPQVANRKNGVMSDDSRIVFISDRDGPDPVGDLGNHEVYSMNPDGSDQRRLTNNPGLDQGAAWSPDGQKIAFARLHYGVPDIYLMNADGSDTTRLTQMAEQMGAEQPAWSPDGKRIVFRTRFRSNLYVINVDGTGLATLRDQPPRGGGAVWSPDGRRIAFGGGAGLVGKAEIYLVDPDGTNVLRLTSNDAWDRAPAWSPDGKKIAFHSDRDGDQEIYVMNADGSNQVRLTFNPAEDGHPTWSPDGKRIAFHRRVLGHFQIYVMNADGSQQRRLTALSPEVMNGYPRWSLARR